MKTEIDVNFNALSILQHAEAGVIAVVLNESGDNERDGKLGPIYFAKH